MEKCPHCGGEPTVDKALRDGYRGMEDDPDAWAFFVICKSCAGQGGWVKNESGAIRMWNMRMTDADNPKDKEEIARAFERGVLAMRDAALNAIDAEAIGRISEKLGLGTFEAEEVGQIRNAADKLLAREALGGE